MCVCVWVSSTSSFVRVDSDTILFGSGLAVVLKILAAASRSCMYVCMYTCMCVCMHMHAYVLNVLVECTYKNMLLTARTIRNKFPGSSLKWS